MAAELEHYNSDVALILKVESGAAIRRLEELVGLLLLLPRLRRLRRITRKRG